MASLVDPAVLFSSATLQLHVPPHPHSTSPPPSTLPHLGTDDEAGADGAQREQETDAWVQQLLQEGGREVGYYDENLSFYLFIRLPCTSSTPPLNRAQATALLLPSPSSMIGDSQPHLQLTADISYVEGSPLPHPPPNQPHQHSSSVSALGNGHPSTSALRKGSLPSLPPPSPDPSRPPPPSSSNKPRMPVTSNPLPSVREQDGYIAAGQGVSVWSEVFSSQPSSMGVKAGKGNAKAEASSRGGRQWLGRVAEEWIGVWEFTGEVSFLQTALDVPRLCLTITATFRDDPHLSHLLLRTGAGDGDLQAAAENGDVSDDDWLVESFDDVNLLASLSSASSTPLHLPASRLPQPFSPSSASPPRPRRISRASVSGALPPLPTSGEQQLHPSIRRSVRRVLGVKAAVGVRMRSVPCSSVAVSQLGGVTAAGDAALGMGAEGRGGTEGLIMCVEVEGVGSADEYGKGEEEEGFEIISVDVEVTPSPSHSSTSATWMGTSDIQIRLLAPPSSSADDLSNTFPLLLGPREQHNFLYSVTFSSEAAAARLAGQGQSFDAGSDDGAGWKGESVPREVATSPSQRFTARFGDTPLETMRRNPSMEIGARNSEQWLRGVAIVVRGRPVTLGSGRGDAGRAEGRSLTRGYAVEDSGGKMEDDDTTTTQHYDSRTTPFSSRWNCTLDISPFAQRSPPRIAAFNPPLPPRPPSLPSSIARLSTPAPSLSSPATKRNSRADLPQIEAVAGSKRHTMSSLASLASKSPVLQQREFKRADLVSQQPEGRPSLALSRTSVELRALPLPPPIDAQTPGATGPQRRFFSLPPGASTPSDLQHYAASPNRPISPLPPPTTPAYPPHHSARSAVPHADPLGRRETGDGAWSSMGLGLDGAGAVHGQEKVAAQRTGNIIVSVSLIPLRIGKSQRPPAVTTIVDADSSSPEMERERQSGRLSPHATFQFPSPTSSPDPSARASPEPFTPSAAAPSPFASTGRRPSASIYPAPAAAPLIKEPRPRAPRIGLLDVFLVEVFIVNRGDEVKRFTVGVPVRKAEEKGVDGDVGPGSSAVRKKEKEEDRVAKIVALENDVRIGPLAPNTCASVRLRFLAIRPGAHTLEELRLVDLGTGLETRLRNPLSVVVE